ncbi:hypothetical protein [Labrenzia sp. VG12]|uniref:hypothetical protein n=1 Tax=Labrenzia sp. VG12 TaxID=2021862 RepID=UPI0012FD493D|nr:hypothetical protein [Labrenzia sp. VG12]
MQKRVKRCEVQRDVALRNEFDRITSLVKYLKNIRKIRVAASVDMSGPGSCCSLNFSSIRKMIRLSVALMPSLAQPMFGDSEAGRVFDGQAQNGA